jgi:DNA-binding Lrp family transcriptional regulator
MPPRTGFDRIDRAILVELQKNGRLSNKDLAERVGLAPSSVLERVRGLRERGVIRGFHAEVDPAALGRGVQALVGVRVRPHSRPIVDEFWRDVLALDETLAIFHTSGTDDFLVHVAVADTNALRDFLLDHLTRRPEVSHLETRIIFREERRIALEPHG